ncbi:nitrate reductase molybdenum cofactor assembly chaperone [Fodinisporobacter ferrooxydans]|uniref:Nitrate reductase molybdenum cofactor assembly chaperone n=1 Tax=Fodinisporobacter ferrooxydans TaxID=2901836 RepID=A0ABY4CP82_9BACL|nr:nitrate reductase molybdenum cofactor assembly chaperone [Alicyclobacillaceae bacterium MYW30-H2]
MTTSTSIPHTEIDREERQRVFQLLSLLLQYPDEWENYKELCEEVANIQHPQIKQCVFSFLEYLEAASIDECKVNYVYTFDFNSKTNLYLTYSNQGEERERGQSLVNLKQLYEAAGFAMTSEELADYLPLVLEFLAVAPMGAVLELVRLYDASVRKIYDQLQASNSPYAAVLQACIYAFEILQPQTDPNNPFKEAE